MHKRTSIVIIVFVVSACDVQEGKPNDASSALFPSDGFKSNVIHGAALYKAHCAHCHGRKGEGTSQGIALVHGDFAPSKRPNLSFFFAVRRGVKHSEANTRGINPLADISAEDTAHIIRFIREQQVEAGIYKRRRHRDNTRKVATLNSHN